MEQAQRGDPEDARVAGERAEAIGAYLGRQRRLRGISIEELSATTRIPVRSLQRLEKGAFDAVPDGFARGFVRTVAIALGLPADETVARMLPEAGGDEPRSLLRPEIVSRLVALAGILLAIGLAVLAFSGSRILPAGWTRERDTVVMRRDAVRALAEATGASPAAAPAPPAVDPAAPDPVPAE
jgi:hypothetical protein